jgi:hypothetical protein
MRTKLPAGPARLTHPLLHRSALDSYRSSTRSSRPFAPPPRLEPSAKLMKERHCSRPKHHPLSAMAVGPSRARSDRTNAAGTAGL